jgi:hypothetical protein
MLVPGEGDFEFFQNLIDFDLFGGYAHSYIPASNLARLLRRPAPFICDRAGHHIRHPASQG